MLDWSALPSGFVISTTTLFGLAIGSFLNVVIHRLPRGESLVSPRSRCPGCGAPIAGRDNIPVLSYLWLRGRCRQCRRSISPRYPTIELLTGGVFAAIAWRYGAVAMMPVMCGFAAALIAAAVIDLDHRVIPDEISLGGLGVALLVVPLTRVLSGAPLATSVLHSAGGALLGAGTLWTLGFTHARLSTWMGRTFEHWPGPGEALPGPSSWDYWLWFPGMGFGDIKLLGMIGAVVGPFAVFETLLAASLAGLLFGLAWVVARRDWNVPFGFGPAIAVGALLVVLAPHGSWLLPALGL